MPDEPLVLLNDDIVRVALRNVWHDSSPGLSGGIEQGGFILRGVQGDLSVSLQASPNEQTLPRAWGAELVSALLRSVV